MEPTTTLLIEGYIREFIILVLLGALGVLWRAYQQAQEKRIEEGLASRDALNNASTTIDKMASAVASLRDAVMHRGEG